MRKLQLRNLVATYSRPSTFYVLLVMLFGALLWFRLGTLIGGYSASELATLGASTGLRHIFENPVNAPFTLLAHALVYLTPGNDLFLMRVAATIVGIITLSVFYWLLRHWHGERSAIFGTIIFGTSAWFLHTARLGTPDVMLFGLLALVALSIWVKRTNSAIVLLLIFGVAASLLYVPGMIWFVLLGIIWQWRTIDRIFKRHLVVVTIGAAGLLAILAPLGLAIYKTPELAKTIAGLPAGEWPQPLEVLQRLGDIPLQLFWRGPLDPEHWLAQLPILSAFSMAMLALGTYVHVRHWRLRRTKLLAAVIVIGSLLASLGGSVSLSIIIPFLYMGVAVGIGFMLDRWFTVFPRNAIAQIVGTGLICLTVTAASWYDLRRYLVAWPATPAAKQTFIIKE